MTDKWDCMCFWRSEEWLRAQEKLDDLETCGIPYNPDRENLFAALDACPLKTVKVCILGQDPYPDPSLACGVAFSIPSASTKFPPTLVNILKEYSEDLGLPFPSHGDLSAWCRQGVLLWNVVPTCFAGSPGSHRDWEEWEVLTNEIIGRCAERVGVFVALGGIARKAIDRFAQSDEDRLEGCSVFTYSHPSPLGARSGINPFVGSRLFSTVNAALVSLKKDPIDWRL